MDIKIAMAYHKPGIFIDNKYIIPIHAGKAISTLDLGIQGDNTGENISHKNPWYCELTALYWLWKNTKADYKGLIHYRRSFSFVKGFTLHKIRLHITFTLRRMLSIWSPYKSVGVFKQYKDRTHNEFQRHIDKFSSHLEDLFAKGYNVIAPYPNRMYFSIERTLCWECGGLFLDLLDYIVRKRHPEFYPYFRKAQKGLWFYSTNLEIMDNATFEEYCTLLFDILECHEKETIARGYLLDISKEKAYSRVSGYMGEMITNAYIQYCKKTKKVKILPVAFYNK